MDLTLTSNLKSDGTCCIPERKTHGTKRSRQSILRDARIPESAVLIPEGIGLVGTNNPLFPYDGEAPMRQKRLGAFRMSPTTVTNAQFAEFIAKTGYITEAEQFGWSFVFWSDLPKDAAPTKGVAGVEWWRKVDGATWNCLDGADARPIPDHPVVHVSWNDAKSYADWAGGSLPSEAQWEHAARGGLADVPYPWGEDAPNDTDHFPCNIWQGKFPRTNTNADGYALTAPAKSFKPNGFGLYNMVGNVWEWSADPFRLKSLKKHLRQRAQTMKGFKVTKGGSFLCHRDYCHRYRIAARTGSSPDSTTSHQGFRIVWDAE